MTFLPPQGFGPEAKTRGGIIVSPAYTYKECVNTPNANMADHSVGARDESNGSEASEAAEATSEAF